MIMTEQQRTRIVSTCYLVYAAASLIAAVAMSSFAELGYLIAYSMSACFSGAAFTVMQMNITKISFRTKYVITACLFGVSLVTAIAAYIFSLHELINH
jgi:hypothetical protein